MVEILRVTRNSTLKKQMYEMVRKHEEWFYVRDLRRSALKNRNRMMRELKLKCVDKQPKGIL
jgi:hypothetical protein